MVGIRFRTNRKMVHFVEEIEVSAPTTWPEPRPGFTVSNDKRSARFEGEVDGSQGYLVTFGGYSVTIPMDQ